MRLKDVDPIIRELQDEEQYGADYFLPIELLKAAPTIEAKPVVRAHWEYDPNGMDWEIGAWRCSKCRVKNDNLGSGDEINPYIFAGAQYCPWCGAQMDEIVSDNNVGSKTEGEKIPVISMEDVPKLAKD